MFAWEDYEFELTGDTQGQIDDLRGALQQRRQPPVLVSYADVYDLSGYSGRVENIGEEKPYYSPCIANRNDDEGWFPQNLPVVVWQPNGESQPVAVPVRNTLREALKTKIEDARGAGRERIEFPGFPRPLPVAEAERIIQAFDAAETAAQRGNFDPAERKNPTPRRRPGQCGEPGVQR